MSLVYSIGESRQNMREIQKNANNGLITELKNKSAKDGFFFMNEKMVVDLLSGMQISNTVVYDENENIYTIFNDVLPQIYAEGISEVTAKKSMILAAVDFAEDYLENAVMFSSIFSGSQQFLASMLILNKDNAEKVREVLRLG